MRGNGHDPRPARGARSRPDCARGFAAVHHRHRYIHQDDVEPLRGGRIHPGAAIAGSAHAVPAGLEHFAQDGAVDVIVLHDQHAERRAGLGRGRRLGRFVRLRRLLKRHPQPEQAALVQPALDPDRAAHQRGKPARDPEPEPGSRFAPVGAVEHLEVLEDPLQIAGRDALAGIAHPQLHLRRVVKRLGLDMHRAVAGELDRIAHEIHQHLADFVGIAQHPVPRRPDPAPAERGAVRQRQLLLVRNDFVEHLRETERPCPHRHLARLQFGDVQHVVHQRREQPPRDLHRLHISALPLAEPGVAQQRHVAQKPVQRGADLVRDHRDEIRLRPFARDGAVMRRDQRHLRLFQLRDIADEQHEDPAQAALREADRHFRREAPAIARLPGDMDPPQRLGHRVAQDCREAAAVIGRGRPRAGSGPAARARAPRSRYSRKWSRRRG